MTDNMILNTSKLIFSLQVGIRNLPIFQFLFCGPPGFLCDSKRIFIRCKLNELSCLTNLIFTTLQTSCFANDVSVRQPKNRA